MSNPDYSASCFNNARFYRHDTVTVVDLYQGFLRIPEFKEYLQDQHNIRMPILEGDLFWMQMMGRPADYPEPNLGAMCRSQLQQDLETEYPAFTDFWRNTSNFDQEKHRFIHGASHTLAEQLNKPCWQTYGRIIARRGLCDLVSADTEILPSPSASKEKITDRFAHPLSWIETLSEAGFLQHPANVWMFVTSLDHNLHYLMMARAQFDIAHWRGSALQTLPKPEISNLLLSATQLAVGQNSEILDPVHLAAGAMTHPRIQTELRHLNLNPAEILENMQRNINHATHEPPAPPSNPVAQWPGSLRALNSFAEWHTRTGGHIAVPKIPRIKPETAELLLELTQRARHRETSEAVITDCMQHLLKHQPPKGNAAHNNMAAYSQQQRMGHTPVSYALVNAGFPENLFYQWGAVSKHDELHVPTRPITLSVGPQEKKVAQFQISDDAFTKALNRFTQDLTALATEKPFAELVGRDTEMQDLVKGINARRMYGVVITGAPGVGKSALSKAYANMIVQGAVPENQKNIRLLEVNIEAMTAGANRVGDFEQNLLDLFQGVAERNRAGATHIILTIPEAHTIFGAGTYDGQPIGAEQRLKKWLNDGDVRVIMDVDTGNYHKYIEKDEAFNRRLAPIHLDPPDRATTLAIVKADAEKASKYYGVAIPEKRIEEIYNYSTGFFKNLSNPDISLKLLDDATNTASVHGELVLSEDTVIISVAKRAHISPDYLRKDPQGLLLDLEQNLAREIIAQPDAITALLDAAAISQAGLKSPNRPIAAMIFSGPTGVGKTQTARELAKIMTGSEDNLLRIDMSEFMTIDSINKLIGTPPGYTNADLEGILTGPVHERPNRVVLFDEIEKAHPDVLNLLLQITDNGQLRDGKGQIVSFKNCWIIASTNVGAEAALKIMRGNTIGFEAQEQDDQITRTRVQETLAKETQSFFRPEFVNRFDIIPFHFLSRDAMPVLLDREMRILNHQLAEEQYAFQVHLSPHAEQELIAAGFSPEYGARPLQRTVEKLLKAPLARTLLKHPNDLREARTRFIVEDIGQNFAVSEELPEPVIVNRPTASASVGRMIRRGRLNSANTNTPPPVQRKM